MRKYLTIIICVPIISLLAYGAYCRNAEWNNPLVFYKKNAEAMPNKARVANNYGGALASEGKYREASIQFIRAISLDPKYDDALYNLGTAYARMGKYDEAYEYFIKALKVNPNYDDAHNSLGMIFAIRGKGKEAAIEFVEAMRLNPNNQMAYNNFKLLMQNIK